MIIDLTGGSAYNVNFYAQERMVIQLRTTAQSVLLYYLATDLIAEYTTPSNGVALIDITDYLRTYPTRNAFSVVEQGVTGFKAVTFVRNGLVDPEGMVIPPHDLTEAGTLIAPPSRLFGVVGYDLDIAFFATTGGWQYQTAEQPFTQLNNGVITIDPNAERWFEIKKDDLVKRWSLTPLECEKRYAVVQWIDTVGNTVLHVLEVREQKAAAVNGYSLLKMDNEFNEIKGKEDSFTLYLDELNDYDMWYYSSLMTSSSVAIKALLRAGGAMKTYVIPVPVEIVTSEVAMPDGVNLGKLELTCKFKRYDAATM